MGRLSGIKNFTIFYGEGGTDRLKGYNLVVVEPKGQSKESVRELKAAGGTVIGYIGMTEVAYWQIEPCGLIDNDFIHVDGKPLINEDFDNLLVSMNAIRWQEALDEEIDYVLRYLGMDGLFFDTVSNLEREDMPHKQKLLEHEGCVKYIQRIRERYPEAVLIQNNGIVSVLPMTAPLIDGLLLENSPLFTERDDFHNRLMGRITELSHTYGLQVFCIASRDYISICGLDERNLCEWFQAYGFIGKISDPHYQNPE